MIVVLDGLAANPGDISWAPLEAYSSVKAYDVTHPEELPEGLLVYRALTQWVGGLGLLLFVVGILGLYLGKIFDQVKGRPLFIVGRTVNLPGEKDG